MKEKLFYGFLGVLFTIIVFILQYTINKPELFEKCFDYLFLILLVSILYYFFERRRVSSLKKDLFKKHYNVINFKKFNYFINGCILSLLFSILIVISSEYIFTNNIVLKKIVDRSDFTIIVLFTLVLEMNHRTFYLKKIKSIS